MHHHEDNKKDHIYIRFDALFEQVKTLSELKSRSMSDPQSERYIITGSDKPVLKTFYEHAVTDIAERLGVLDRMQDYGSRLIYKLTCRQTEQGAKRTVRIVEQCFLNYLLYRWYRSVGMGELASEYYQFFEADLRQQRSNSTQPGFVTPKYKPWW